MRKFPAGPGLPSRRQAHPRAFGHTAEVGRRERGGARPTCYFVPGAGKIIRMRVLILPVILVAGCSYGAVPLTEPELALREATAVRGSDLDRALFCGADPARVVDRAKTVTAPPYLPPTLIRDFHDLLVARVEVTKNLRGSNADNPDCMALKARPDLAQLWPVETSKSPNARPRTTSS